MTPEKGGATLQKRAAPLVLFLSSLLSTTQARDVMKCEICVVSRKKKKKKKREKGRYKNVR
tara:strand:- start:1529 stop:1711 length:183 start_codon:yes stop_codon:yes gene_type:complete